MRVKPISEQIFEARKIAGLTQHEVSLAMDRKTNVCYLWEKGLSTPTLTDLEKLKKVLRVKQFKI